MPILPMLAYATQRVRPVAKPAKPASLNDLDVNTMDMDDDTFEALMSQPSPIKKK